MFEGEDIGLAEKSRQGVGHLETLNVKANRLCRISRGMTVEVRYLSTPSSAADDRKIRKVRREEKKHLKVTQKKKRCFWERNNPTIRESMQASQDPSQYSNQPCGT